MDSGALPLIAFASIFGGMLLGMFLRTLLNEQHLSPDSRDDMKLAFDLPKLFLSVQTPQNRGGSAGENYLYPRGEHLL